MYNLGTMENIMAVARCVLWFFLIVLFGVFVCALSAPSGGVFAKILEITGMTAKQETLKFISLGMGGVLAAIAAVELNLRATAAMKNAEAMTKNNVLTEKGHIEERFKTAVQHLGSRRMSARIASFYQLYYLAKDNPDPDFVKNIHEILCAHLRQTTRDKEYIKNNSKYPSEECQSLLDILFKNPQNLFMGMKADLRDVHLVGANFHEAQLQEGSFKSANLQHAFFWRANVERAFFTDALLQNANFTVAHARHASFQGSDVENADFTYTDLHIADMVYAKNLDKAKLFRIKGKCRFPTGFANFTELESE